jgi:hypothetical protein
MSIPDRVVVTPTPTQEAVPIQDIVTRYVTALMEAPQLENRAPQLSLVTNKHSFILEIEEDDDGGQPGLGWLDSLVDEMLGDHIKDEVVREAGFVVPQADGVVLLVWDCLGNGFNGRVWPREATALGQPTLPPSEMFPDLVALVEHVGRHLWGQHWKPIVDEEDRW